jgi:hypothetical protein
MNDKKDEDLVEKLKELFNSVLPPSADSEYPIDALPSGTFARCVRNNKLGIITDAFYGDLDEDNVKIIIYTLLLFPGSNSFHPRSPNDDQYFLVNEYEYDIIGYLMIPPADIKNMHKMGGSYL